MSQPIIEKVKSYIPDTTTVKNTVSSVGNTISNGLENAKTGVQNTLGAFSQKNVVNASSDFLESNALFAKFAFIILIFIIFLAFFKLGVNMIAYFLQPSSSPYIVKGLLDGNSTIQIKQNPSDPKAIVVTRSVNAGTGVEFTWSIWLYIQFGKNDSCDKTGATYGAKPIFVKGTPSSFTKSITENKGNNITGINTVNGPGMYLTSPSSLGYVNMDIIMDDIMNIPNIITIDNLPLNKWVHVAYRLENTILDTYVNGVITQRLQMKNAPKQNFYDIYIGPNGGFPGKLSNLQYFNRALNVFEINNMVMFGPNLKSSSLSNNSEVATGNYSYISSSWYSNFYSNT